MEEIIATAVHLTTLKQRFFYDSNGYSNMAALPMPFPLPFPLPIPGAHGYTNNAAGYGRVSAEGPFDDEYDSDYEDDDEQIRTLYCNNLDDRVTEAILYEVFLQAGPIESARIPLDANKRTRNFGFVTYQHKSAVSYALRLYKGLELFKKPVYMKQQEQEKPKFGPSLPMDGARSLGNPFMNAPSLPMNERTGGRWHPRHSMHEGNPYDRNQSSQNNYMQHDNRRRSDSAIMDRSYPRQHHHRQHHNKSGGHRRPDQRHDNNKRRLL